MKKFHFTPAELAVLIAALIFMSIGLVLVSTASAQQPAETTAPEWTDMGYGRYQIVGNFMVWEMNTPVMTDRFSKYGSASINRGEITIDTKAENKTVPAAKDLREKLLLLRDPNGIFKLSTVTLQFQNQIRIERKGDTDWEILKEDIIPLFNDTYGKPAE